MAQEGIAAALTIPDEIMRQLEIAQQRVEAMAKSAERMGAGFQSAASAISVMSGAVGANNIMSALNANEAVNNINSVAQATTQLNKSQSAAAQGAKELSKALKMKETSNIKVIEQKMAAIRDALAAPGLKAKQIEEANAELARLEETLTRLRNSGQQAFDGIRQSLASAKSSGSIENLKSRIDMLRESLRQMKALEKTGFTLPAGSVAAVTNEIGALNKQIQAANTLLGVTGRNANMVRGMLSMAFNPIMIASFLKNLVTIRGEFEMAQRSLSVLIQNERMAEDMFEEISQIAVRSPFSVLQINQNVKALAAYRIEADKLIEKTKMLGDISAGVGVDINRLILAYGQVKAASFLKGQELRQFSEAGVNMLGGLADRFSEIYKRAVSTGEVLQMISKRMVMFEDVDAVLSKQTAEGGTFYKMQEKQAETLKGMLVNLRDRIQLMFNETGQSFDGLMKSIVKGLQWIISNSRLVSSVLMPLVTMKVTSGFFGMLRGGTLAKAFGLMAAGVKTANASMATLEATGTRAFGLITRNIRRAGAAMASLNALQWQSVLGIVLAIGAAIALWIRNATAFRKEIEQIMKDAQDSTDQSIAQFNRLVDKANDLTRSEKDRLAAVEEIRKQYGNILPIQDLELSNVEKLKNARAEYIELIKEQIRQEARGDVARQAIKELNRTAERRTKQLMRAMNSEGGGLGDILSYAQSMDNIEKLSKDEVDGIRKIIETQLIDGTLESAEEAGKEFLRMYFTRANATEEQIEQLFNDMGDIGISHVSQAFEDVINKINVISGKAAETAFDYSTPRFADEYIKQIKEIENVRKNFIESLSLEQKKAYDANPAQLELDIRDKIRMEKARLEAAISNQSFGALTDVWAKKLNDALSAAYRRADDMSKTKQYVLMAQKQITDEYGQLTKPIGGAEKLMMKENQSIGDYAASVHDYIKELESTRVELNAFQRSGAEAFEALNGETISAGQVFEQYSSWAEEKASKWIQLEDEMDRVRQSISTLEAGSIKADKEGDAERKAAIEKQIAELKDAITALEAARKGAWGEFKVQAIRNINEEIEGLEAFVGILGKRTKKETEINAELSARKKLEQDSLNYVRSLITLSKDWDQMTQEERNSAETDARIQAFTLGINIPEDTKGKFSVALGDLDRWINKEIKDKFGDEKIIPLRAAFSRESHNELKRQQSDLAAIAKDVIGAIQKQGKYSQDVLDALWASLQERVDEFNARKDTNFTLTLPVKLGLQEVTDWVEELKERFSKGDLTDILALLFDQKTGGSGGGGGRNTLKQRQNEIKNFVNEVISAVKEYEKLNDEGKGLLENKIRLAGEELKVAPPEKLDKNTVNKWVEGMKKELGEPNYIDVKLAINKDDAEDALKDLSKQVSDLWDKYDNAKKLEGFGLSFTGKSSLGVLDELKQLEDKLRKEQTEGATDLANQIAERLLQIARTEQEEAAKIMYEAQKKALDKTQQAYFNMYEDIKKIRENATKGDSNVTQASIDTAVTARIKKGMQEVADAQWEAYKSTRSYAIAFGDLKGLGKITLDSIKQSLEAFQKSGALNPTEMRAIAEAIEKINAQSAMLADSADFVSVFKKSFEDASKAAKMRTDDIPKAEEQYAKALDYTNTWREKVKNLRSDQLSEGVTTKNTQDLANAELMLAEAERQEALALSRLDTLRLKANKLEEGSEANLKNMAAAYDAVGSEINKVFSFVKDLSEAFGTDLGEEAEAAMDGFANGFGLVGTAISIAAGALTVYNSLQAAGIVLGETFMATMWPLLAIGAALGAVVAILKANDASITKRVEEHKDAVEKLEKEYEKLEDAMKRALDMRDAAAYNKQMMQNLEAQKQEIQAAIDLERSRNKQTSKVKDTIQDLEDQMDGVQKSITSAKDDWLEFMGSFSNSQSEARNWASSWLEAFKDAESGVTSLNDSFDDMYDEIVSTQLASILGPQMESLKQLISSAVRDGFIDEAEAAAILAQREALSSLDAQLRERAQELGAGKYGTTETDTLQRGLESMTEQTAQALESILNSTRFYVADNNRILLRLDNVLANEENENSILSGIRSQTKYLQTLSQIAQAVYSPGSTPSGAGGLKVFVMG